jgi:hypothetical protein
MNRFRYMNLVLATALVSSSVLFIGEVHGEEGLLQSTGFESLSPLEKTPTGWNKTEISQ